MGTQDGALIWRRSSRCSATGCLEVAVAADGVHLRDSKDPGGPHLILSVEDWRDFITDVRTHRLLPPMP